MVIQASEVPQASALITTVEQDLLVKRIVAALTFGQQRDLSISEALCRIAVGIDAVRAQSLAGAFRLRRNQSEAIQNALDCSCSTLRQQLPQDWHSTLDYGLGACSYLRLYWAASRRMRLTREDYLPDADGAAYVLVNALLSVAQLKVIDGREQQRLSIGLLTFGSIIRSELDFRLARGEPHVGQKGRN